MHRSSTHETILATLPAGVRVHRAAYVHSGTFRALADALGVLEQHTPTSLEVYSLWLGTRLLGVLARSAHGEWCWARGAHLTVDTEQFVLRCACSSALVALYTESRA